MNAPSCRARFAELATACGDCAEERVTCEGQVQEDDVFYHGQVKYEFETKVALRAQGSASAQDCVDALREHLKSTALERYRDANHVFSDFEFETGVARYASVEEDEWIPDLAPGYNATRLKVKGPLGLVCHEGLATKDDGAMMLDAGCVPLFGAALRGAFEAAFADFSEPNCDVDQAASAAALPDAGDVSLGGTSWKSIHWKDLPPGKTWLQPYGDARFMNAVQMWAPAGCKYPNYGYQPAEPLCASCSSMTEAIGETGL